MDWTMISNADGPLQRVRTLYYLLQCRYEMDEQVAGKRFREVCQTNDLCRLTLDDLRAELASPTGDIGFRKVTTDTGARRYLRRVLDAFDSD